MTVKPLPWVGIEKDETGAWRVTYDRDGRTDHYVEDVYPKDRTEAIFLAARIVAACGGTYIVNTNPRADGKANDHDSRSTADN
jgi:hypothetical protein